MSSEDQLYLIEQLANEFFARQEQDRVSVSEFVAQHPEHADELRDFIEGLQLVRNLQLDIASPKSEVASEVVSEPSSVPTSTGFPEIPDYRIIGELGRGAMGVVYEAEQLSLGRRVALKTMLHAGESRGRLRFQHEARTAARLHHPGIVPVYDVGESDGLMYYAMQYIDGRGLDRVSQAARDALRSKTAPGTSVESALANWLTNGKQALSGTDFKARRTSESGVAPVVLSTEADPSPSSDGTASNVSSVSDKSKSSGVFSGQKRSSSKYRQYHRSIARIGWHVADALAFAHEHGVIHRDIKPANLLLDTSGEVWVADFGLVKTHDSSHTQSGAFVGTLRYMAPERFQGQCDVRSDVYSLGMTLYELLALRPALDSTDQMSLLNQIRDTDPQPLRLIEHRIPRDLEVIVTRAIQKEPHRRYATARSFAEDLDNYLNGRPIQARQVSTVEKSIIWARRKPIVAGLLALLMMGLVTTICGSVYAAFAFRDIAGVATAAKLEAESTLARSNYHLAWSRWEENHANEADDYLDRIPKSYRNIEWALAKRNFHGGSTTLRPSSKANDTVRFTPDGSKIVSTGRRSISINDWHSGELLRVIQLDTAPYSLAMSPGGLTFAVGYKDGKVVSWNVQTGQQVWEYYKRDCVIKAVQFSPDGNSLAFVEDGGRVSLLDTDDGKVKWSEKGHGNDANQVSFHPSGEHLVTVGLDRRIRFWNTTDGKQLATISILEAEGELSTVAYCPDGRGIAVGTRGGTIRFYSVLKIESENTSDGPDENSLTLSPVSVMRGHDSNVNEIAFCPDGARLISSGSDTTIRIWRVDSGEEIKRLRGHDSAVRSVDVASNGYHIASANGKTVRLWDARLIGSQTTYRGHTDRVLELQFSRDGRELLTNSGSEIRLWNAHTLDEVQRFDWNEAQANQAVFSPDGHSVVACSSEGKIQVWNRATGESIGSYDRGNDNIERLAFSHDGTLVATADEKEAVLLDFSRLTELEEERVPKGKRRNLLTHPARVRTLDGFRRDVTYVAFCPDDRLLATGDRSGLVFLWDFRTGEQLQRFDCKMSRINDISFSPDGARLIAVGSKTASIWDLREGRLVGELVGHQERIQGVDFAPDGSRIATAGSDATVRIWDAATGAQLCKLEANSSVNTVRFSPNGKRIAAGQFEAVSIWDTEWDAESEESNRVANLNSIQSAFPAWHAKEAKRAREQGNWFAAVVHLTKQAVMVPSSLDTQLQVYIAARTLRDATPNSIPYLPGLATECEIVQRAINGEALEMTEAWAGAIHTHVRKRVVTTSTPIVDIEFELIQQVRKAFRNPEYMRTLALTHYRRNEFGRAIAMIESHWAETVAAKTPLDYQVLAMSHIQLGNIEIAKSYRDLSRPAGDAMEAGYERTAENKLMRKELNQLMDLHK